MKKKIAVIFGGKSPEHEVSIESAKTVCAKLRQAGFAVLPFYAPREGAWRLVGLAALTAGCAGLAGTGGGTAANAGAATGTATAGAAATSGASSSSCTGWGIGGTAAGARRASGLPPSRKALIAWSRICSRLLP